MVSNYQKALILIILISGIASADFDKAFTLASDYADLTNFTHDANPFVQPFLNFSVGSGLLNMSMSYNGVGYIHVYSPVLSRTEFQVSSEYQLNSPIEDVWFGVTDSTYKDTTNSLPRPLGYSVKLCQVAGSAGWNDCCIWERTGGGSAVVEQLLFVDDYCANVTGDWVSWEITRVGGNDDVTVMISSENFSHFIGDHDVSLFGSSDLYSEYIGRSDASGIEDFDIFVDYWWGDSTVSELYSCGVEYDPIIAGNYQTIYGYTDGVPSAVYFQIDDVNYTATGGGGGSPYYYEWKITDESLGIHNITCWMDLGGLQHLNTTYDHDQASYWITVFDGDNNLVVGQNVTLWKSGIMIDSLNTNGIGVANFNVTGDPDIQYYAKAHADGFTYERSDTVINDTYVTLTIDATFSTITVRTYLDDEGYCGGLSSYISLTRSIDGFVYSSTGTDCVDGIGTAVFSVLSGTYSFFWEVAGIDTQAYDLRTVGTNDNIIVDLYGSLGGEIDDVDTGYSSVAFTFAVYDSVTGLTVENATVRLAECLDMVGYSICNDNIKEALTNSSGEAYFYVSYHDKHEVTVIMAGYETQSRTILTEFMGTSSGCCGNVDKIIQTSMYIDPFSSLYTIVEVDDCNTDAPIGNVTVACEDYPHIGGGFTNSSGQVAVFMTQGEYLCEATKSGYYEGGFPLTIPHDDIRYTCITSMSDGFTVEGYVYDNASVGLEGVKVLMSCARIGMYNYDIHREAYTNASGYYNMTDIPESDCKLFASKNGYTGATLQDFPVSQDRDNMNMTLYPDSSSFAVDVFTYDVSYDEFKKLSDVRVEFNTFSNSNCTESNLIDGAVSYTKNGYAYFVFSSDEINPWIKISGSKDGYRSESSACAKIGDGSTYNLYFISNADAEANIITVDGMQTCGNDFFPLNDFYYSISDQNGRSIKENIHVTNFLNSQILDDGAYSFNAYKLVEGEKYISEVMRGYKIDDDDQFSIMFDDCFVNGSVYNTVIRDQEHKTSLDVTEDMLYSFLPIIGLMFIIGIFTRVSPR